VKDFYIAVLILLLLLLLRDDKKFLCPWIWLIICLWQVCSYQGPQQSILSGSFNSIMTWLKIMLFHCQNTELIKVWITGNVSFPKANINLLEWCPVFHSPLDGGSPVPGKVLVRDTWGKVFHDTSHDHFHLAGSDWCSAFSPQCLTLL